MADLSLTNTTLPLQVMRNRLIKQRKPIAHRAFRSQTNQLQCRLINLHCFHLGNITQMVSQHIRIQPLQVKTLTAGEDGDRNLARLSGGKDKFHMRRRLLQRL